jgi:hypothetical protein
MRFLNEHILGLGRHFLVLFFLANSGFTVVLYHCTMTQCTMTDEMSGMACCSGKNGCTAGSCEDMAGSQAIVAHTSAVDQPCRTATVIGGYQTEPTVVEKEFNGQQILKADLLPASLYETAIGSRLDLPVFHPASSASNVSTSSVETYVLNASFLI